jgi:hypothetical protein
MVICIKGMDGGKPTLVLVDPNSTHNLMFETFESRVYAHCSGSF